MECKRVVTEGKDKAYLTETMIDAFEKLKKALTCQEKDSVFDYPLLMDNGKCIEGTMVKDETEILAVAQK